MPSNSLKNNNPKTPPDILPYNNAFEFYLAGTEINKIYNILALEVAKYILLIPYGIARFTNHNTIALIMGAGHIALDCVGNYYRLKYSMETLNSYLKYFSTYEENIEPKITTLVSLFYKPYDIAENLIYSLSSFTYNKIAESVADHIYKFMSAEDMKPCFNLDKNNEQAFFTQSKEHEDFINLNLESLPNTLKLCVDDKGENAWSYAFLEDIGPQGYLVNTDTKTGLYFHECPPETQEFYQFIKSYSYSKQSECRAKYGVKYAITLEAYKQCFGDTSRSYSTSSAYKAERECLNSPERTDIFSTSFSIINTHDEL
ncbi:hypothetical protein NF27_DP01190 [Candidatus Jidaibacter acanthamoeba]|uniref:Uncharacterized protein n=1 Tax=Candidatus Jidaibacter acanthamoebae TaxID=86105 RepID=A0A0C1QZW9_9RICK|nr:hypothetical protein [Candidatus Jidaibacter acanthamoeba]KIE05575.1 hypothetical protein NF27_DP01190 [Candidatus Jidaibacter acanthamoeba]